MAELVAGVGTSHVPGIGAALDNGRTGEYPWKPIFDGYGPVREWIAGQRPEVAVVVYNDHGAAFSLDTLPTFAVGAAASYPVADEGWGPRPVPPIIGDTDLSWHLIESLVQDEFDVAICQRLVVDHGLSVPLSILFGQPESWPVRVVPIALNVIQYPMPTARRCFRFGQAIRRAIDSYAPDARVAMIGTGGMSHQLQGQRAGHINSEFDRMFLDKIGTDPESLMRLSTADYIRLAGSEGAELVMWLVMRGAMNQQVRAVYADYHVPASNTAAGIVALANA